MPIAQINMMAGRTEEQKSDLIRQVTDAIMDALDAPEGNVRVLINEIPKNTSVLVASLRTNLGVEIPSNCYFK